MTTFKQKHKKLCKSYKKYLKQLNGELSSQLQDPTTYFVTYLKLLRDYHLLSSDAPNEQNLELASLVTAIAEYERSQTCISNYYIIENDVLTRRPEFTEEQALQSYQAEKLQHWEAFWGLVKLSVESWVPNAEF